MNTSLYMGTVVHQRYRPVRHRLQYRLFWMLFDLDELPALRSRLFSHNRFNLVSFHERDHLDGSGTPLRKQIESLLATHGIAGDIGAVRLLCMPRVLGHVFNPISVYFCYGRDDRLLAMLYEVNNTFGERHSYLIPVADPDAKTIRQSCDKAFYVSPFMRMALTYDFRVVAPNDSTAIVVDGSDAEGKVISASFAGRRRALTDRALLGVVCRHGLLALQVLGAIHWEAAKLWLKGLRLQPRPTAPEQPVTFVAPDRS